MRVVGDPAARILVFDRNEWECFIDGARNGEFDDAAGLAAAQPRQVLVDGPSPGGRGRGPGGQPAVAARRPHFSACAGAPVWRRQPPPSVAWRPNCPFQTKMLANHENP